MEELLRDRNLWIGVGGGLLCAAVLKLLDKMYGGFTAARQEAAKYESERNERLIDEILTSPEVLARTRHQETRYLLHALIQLVLLLMLAAASTTAFLTIQNQNAMAWICIVAALPTMATIHSLFENLRNASRLAKCLFISEWPKYRHWREEKRLAESQQPPAST